MNSKQFIDALEDLEKAEQAARATAKEYLINSYKQLQAELEQHHWIPVSERLPKKRNNSYCSAWVVATDTKTWTIAQYNYEYAHWDKDHSPYDIGMLGITHWKPVILRLAEKQIKVEKITNPTIENHTSTTRTRTPTCGILG